MRTRKEVLANKEILTTREVALLLNVTTQTIKNYIYAGRLKALRTPGGHHRIRRADLKSLGFDLGDNPIQQIPSQDELLESYNKLTETFDAVVKVFAKCFDTRDIVRTGHSARVADLACKAGQQLSFSAEKMHELKLSAWMHDIGKIGINEAILGKPGKLTDQEFFFVKQHCEIGETIAAQSENLKPVAPFIRHHHERYDGTGYPDGLAGNNIEVQSRIIAVADAYDVMCSDLPHRPAFSESDALAEIKNCAGTQFDPMVADVFIDTVKGQSKYMQ